MANVKPLGQLQALSPEAVKPKKVAKTPDTIAHSKRNAEQSKKYHAGVLGGTRASDSGTARLNPNPSVAKANKQGRSFPGLAE